MRATREDPITGLRDFRFIVDQTNCNLTPRARAIEAVDPAGRIVGMVAYDHWTFNSAQAHIAVEYAAVWKRLLRPAFQYPFVQVGVGVLIGVIAADNPRSLAFTKRIGFRETHRVRDGHAVGIDLVVHEMRREECRWLEVIHAVR